MTAPPASSIVSDFGRLSRAINASPLFSDLSRLSRAINASPVVSDLSRLSRAIDASPIVSDLARLSRAIDASPIVSNLARFSRARRRFADRLRPEPPLTRRRDPNRCTQSRTFNADLDCELHYAQRDVVP